MTKKNTLLLLMAAGTGWLALTSYSSGPGTGGLGDMSSSNCGGSGCHPNNSSATVVQSIVLVDAGGGGTPTPSGQYIPGRTYTVSVIGNLNPASTSLTHFGFQTTARNAGNATVGTIDVTGNTSIHTYTGNGRTGVEHSTKIAKNSGGFFTTTWRWTAPMAGTGPVTFYTALNAVNNNGNVLGDQPNVGTTTFSESPLGVEDVTGSASIAIHPNPAKDRIRLDTRNWKAGEYRITILNATGGSVYQQAHRIDGAADLEVRLPALATGLYAVRVQGQGMAQAAPLFIR